MPALTEFYGITPVDVDAMTYREVDQYLTQMAEAQQRQEASNGSTG